MSTEDWKLEKDLCRCCHSEGTFKSLATCDSMIVGKDIAYFEVLRSCLSIELITVDGPLLDTAYSICELCIARLQDAHGFRQQVLQCEEYFYNLYSRNCIKVGSAAAEVKQELPDSDDGDLGVDQDGHSDEFPSLDEEKPIEDEKCRKVGKVTRGANKRGRPRTRDITQKDCCVQLQDNKTKTPVYRLQRSDYSRGDSGYTCARCNKIFNSLSGLRFHVKSQHLALAAYTCHLCDTPFRTLAPFTKHKLEKHAIDDRIKCNACDSIFNTKTQLMKHRNSFHMLGVKHKCPNCDYECFSVEAMYKHKFKHKTNKDYHCKFCRKSFLRKTTLDLHERIHTGDRRKVCMECGQAFVQKASLNYHMTKYHPEVKF